ncbi:MAG: hypothetical protein RMJ59_06090 [Candidatus Nitrosocaldus sp.]|nr:hypothetical protein [Candidatus Nitrosocaldus sp.]MDW8275932.1 hypothetical protein [Candidatus Nitrosocaldus sp.]
MRSSMKRITNVAFLLPLIINLIIQDTYAQVATPLYSHISDDGRQTYWNISPSSMISYLIHESGTPDVSGTTEFSAVQESFQKWESDVASYIDFGYAGTTNRPASLLESESNRLDCVNVVKWVNYNIGFMSALALASNSTRYTNSNIITEFDIAFNDYHDWARWCINGASSSDGCITGEYDIPSVALHEVGHVLFLEDLYPIAVDLDSDPYNDVNKKQVMYYSFQDATQDIRQSLNYGDRAGVRYIYANTNTAGSSVGETQGADIAAGAVNDGSTVDYVLAWADNPVGANSIRYRYGWDVSSSTGVPSSWSTDYSITGIGDETQGVGVNLINLDSNSRLDLIIAWIDNPVGNNTIKYRIGWNIDTSGVPASWSSTKTVPSSDVGNESQELAITLSNIDSNSRPEMFVFWVDNPSGANKIYYKIGWNVNTSGDASSWSSRIDTGIQPGDETRVRS